jgi:hypothetical protein
MTTHPSSGTAGPVTPTGDRQRGRGPGAVPAAVLTRAGLRRHSSRDLWAVTAALAGPLTQSPVRATYRRCTARPRSRRPPAHRRRSPRHVGDLLAGLLDLQEWRFEYGSLRSHPPRLELGGSIVDGQNTWDVEQEGLPHELELRVIGNGQYYGRFLMRPASNARPTAQARLVAVALAEQVGHSYSAAGVSAPSR